MTDQRDDERRSFLKDAGWGEASAYPLPGDASSRRYFRVTRGGQTALLMDQPQTAETPVAPPEATPEERRALGYNALARLAGADVARFAAAAAYLRKRGLTAPEIYAADAAKGILLIEDFGDALYVDAIAGGSDETELYEAAIDALAVLHEEEAPLALGPGFPLFAYDETALLAETDLFTEWFVPAALHREARPEEIAEHRALWGTALRTLETSRPVFVHRDYHAQNLLWLSHKSRGARAGLIDFQDAVAGSPAYDLVSLLEDARRDVPPALASAMTERYLAATGAFRSAFRAEAAFHAAQRNAKIVGIFARLAKRDGKPHYLSYIPRVWGHLERDLEHPALQGLKAWYDKTVPRSARGALTIR